jgi:hypothetical protein
MAQDFAIFLRRLPGTISGAMTIKTIRWLIYPVLAFQLAAMFRVLRPSRFIAKSAATHIGAVHYNGGTSPFALGSAAVIVVVYLLLMFAKPAEFGKTLPGISRRIFAACIDFTLAMSIATPIGSLALVVVAWRTTHVFQWIVQRDSPGPGEAFEALGSFSACCFFTLPGHSCAADPRRASACSISKLFPTTKNPFRSAARYRERSIARSRLGGGCADDLHLGSTR